MKKERVTHFGYSQVKLISYRYRYQKVIPVSFQLLVSLLATFKGRAKGRVKGRARHEMCGLFNVDDTGRPTWSEGDDYAHFEN